MYDRLSRIASKEYSEAVKKLDKLYRIKRICTEADAAADRRKIAGAEGSQDPIMPINPVDAFQLFKDYYAMIQFEYQKHLFLKKYCIFNAPSIEAELKDIQDWIRASETQSYSDACSKKDFSNPQHEYLRLVNGYYEGAIMTREHYNTHMVPAEVYGRYVLFYQYLRQELEKMTVKSESADPKGLDTTMVQCFDNGFDALPANGEQVELNNFLELTIDEYFEEFKKSGAILTKDYDNIVRQFGAYFRNEPHRNMNPIFVRKGNKKKLARACGEIFRCRQSGPLSFEYLDFIRQSFEIFIGEVIEKEKPNESNLYKYCTQKN